MMFMEILIVGLGSIGSEIAYTFYPSANITCLDHGKNFESIRKILPKINYVQGDAHDSSLLLRLSCKPDIVFYCIDTGSVVSCMKNPYKYEKINTVLFRNFLENLYKNHNPHFFLLSSSYVYPDIDKITEETEPKPDTLYGKFRLEQEKILKEISSNFTILRLSNIFGYGKFFNIGSKGAIEKFIEAVFLQKKIFLHGDGKQLVDYLHKCDLMNLLQILSKTKPIDIYNVSSGKSFPILDVAKTISTIGMSKFNKKIEISIANTDKLPNSPKIFPTKIMKNFDWSISEVLSTSILKMMNDSSKYY